MHPSQDLMKRHDALSNVEVNRRIDSFMTLRMDHDEPTTRILEAHRSDASIEHWEDESMLALVSSLKCHHASRL